MSLAPMIDVVFLLLVFFMLASQFGRDLSVPLASGQNGQAYQGPPRHVLIGQGGVRLNGHEVPITDLANSLERLMSSPLDSIVLQPDKDASLQNLLDIADELTQAGFLNLVVVE